MDSRMLNVFHEDPFEGNFVKYDPEPNFWSANDDLQLTDTLNGILPIAPTDESLLGRKESDEQLQNNKNLLIYSDFVDQHLSDDVNVLNGQVYRHISGSEVEAAYKQQRQLSALINSDDDEDDEDVAGDEVQSQCSNSTFRTRTDSSSIGDYESHSSDYDDDVPDEPMASLGDAGHLLTADMFALQDERKNRTLSTNTIGSDADALGLNIDVNNFDLADFITKDDFADNLSSLRAKQAVKTMEQSPAPIAVLAPVAAIPIPIAAPAKAKAATTPAVKLVTALPKPVIISSKSRDSDYDSDSIIDVETVDVIDVDESLWVAKQQTAGEAVVPADDLCYVDNVKADPSWSPKQPKQRIVSAEHKAASSQTAAKTAPVAAVAAEVAPTTAAPNAASAAKPKTSNNICLVPNKKQCEFLKRKVGGKAAVSTATSGKTKAAAKKAQEANHKSAAACKQLISTGLGLGGKNLALLKHERDAAVALLPTATVAASPAPVSVPAPKRKLNLEEYKQRKSGGGVAATSARQQTPVPAKQPKLEASKVPVVAPPMPVQKTQPSPQKAAICSIVNSLKSPTSQAAAPPTDPITVAKNKVLRMLELKRAQQLKIIDSRVSAKVPRVTKLPPLKDIVKDTYCMETEPEPETHTAAAANSKLHADYEEIIIVSASCNTDITIPPHQASVALRDNKTTTPSSRSLLKSSVLLYNMSHSSEAGKDMTNSLIASIQSEVVRQTNCVALAATSAAGAEATTGAATATQADKNAQHGEDKVIMHLAKNRVRKRMVSMGTQTDLQPEFPLLTLPTTRQSRERTRRSYRKRRVDGSNGSSSGSSTSSSSSSMASYRSRSNSNSTERLRHSDATAACSVGGSINGGGYSSRSTRRHRSSVSSSSYSESGKYERQQRQRRTSYNKRRSKNLTRDNCSTSGSEFSDRERSRSRSPLRRSRSPTVNNSSNSNNNRRGYVDRNVSQPAVEERRIVYVGRIEQETTKEMLRRKFLPYGSIKQITIHYKENGMKYGFVTFERAQDAFTAIDTSPRDAQINMYDISFGGRRAFCRASYADLDNAGINNYHSYVFPKAAPAAAPQEDSFEALLLKVKAKLNAGKPGAGEETAPPTTTVAGDNSNSNNGQI